MQAGRCLKRLPALSMLRFEWRLWDAAGSRLLRHEAAGAGACSAEAVPKLCIPQACSQKLKLANADGDHAMSGSACY